MQTGKELATSLANMINSDVLQKVREHAEKSSTLLSDTGAEAYTHEFDMLVAAIHGIQRTRRTS